MTDNISPDEIINYIRKGISEKEEISYFSPYYKSISNSVNFLGMKLDNEWFYRSRPATDELFRSVDELKYPPISKAVKGRLNDAGEQVAYMSLDELATIVELDLDFFQLFCTAKIRHKVSDTIFYLVGVRGDYEGLHNDTIVNKFFMGLLNEKSKESYNATIGLARHFLGSNSLDRTGNKFKTGMIYNSVHQDKTNKNLYNIAMYPYVFDDCCEIDSAIYQFLRFDPYQNEIVLEEINHGQVNKGGSINWEKSFRKMKEDLLKNFSDNIYFFEPGESIVHYKYGGGNIISEDVKDYLVSFRCGEIKIGKMEVQNRN